MKYKLDDVCIFINGGAWSDKEYVNKGLPVLKVTNCKSKGFELDDIDYLPISSSQLYAKNKLVKGDIVIATVGSHPNLVDSTAGRSCIVSSIVEGFYLNQNAVCIRTKDSNILDQKYLGYLTKYRLFQHYIQMRGKGAANQMRIAIGAIKSFEFDFPDIDTQRRIGNILSSYDALIEINQRQIKLLGEAAQRLYKEWFVNLRFPGYEDAQIVDGVPEGWRKVTLSEISDVIMGQSPKSEFYNKNKEGLPFHQGVGSYGNRFVKDDTYSTSYTRIAEAESILFSVRAPVGRLNITKNKIVIGRGLSAINHKEHLQSFLFYLLKERYFKEDMVGNGSIFASISKNELLGQEFIVPSSSLQRKFDSIASSIDRQIDNLDTKISLLTEARDRLLPKLMSGEIEL